MPSRQRGLDRLWICVWLAATAAPLAQADSGCHFGLRLIEAYSIPASTRVEGDLFGGISGIEYLAQTGQWYLVSDDRSEHSSARFFLAAIRFDSKRVQTVALRRSQRLKGATQVFDSESIRKDPLTNELLIANEGDSAPQSSPSISRVDESGLILGALPLPADFETRAQSGPRPNRSIEGLSFAPGGHALWIALESPLLQEGPVANVRHGADVRLTRWDRDHSLFSHSIYRTDAAHPHKPGESSDNGISEILTVSDSELLVLERSGIQQKNGGFRFHSSLYCTQPTDRRLTKRLILSFDSLSGTTAGNLEGMTWGPSLSNGHRTLVLASDNNFFTAVPTQLLFFELEPRP